MNVLLIQPEKLPGTKDTRASIPISLLYLSASARKNGHNPFILDFSTMDVPQEEVDKKEFFSYECMKYIEKENINFIGINCFTTMHFPQVMEIAKIIKENFKKIPICTGGAHPTFFAQDIIKNCADIDFIVTGEGEESLVLLLDTFEKTQCKNERDELLKLIPALVYKDSKLNLMKNDREGYISKINDFDMPAWDLVDIEKYYGDYSKYYNPNKLKFNLTVAIITSRSCPYSCSFCSAHLIMEKKYRSKTASQVVDEIEYLHKQRGQNYFAFMDDVINISSQHIIDISNEIIKRNLKIQFSINQGIYIANATIESIDALIEAGLVTVSLPIEHGDEKMRRKILNKNLKDEKIFEIAEHIKKKDIFTVGLYIMGFPEETEESLQNTYDMINKLNLDINGVSTLVPFPRTPVYDQAVRDNLLIHSLKETWSGNDFLDPSSRDGFWIKPYNTSIDTLQKYRDIFDNLYFTSDRAKALNLQ
ncbi:MAG: radical SAM protein [Campylobacterota bacterium]|nr:radical SAM protein [Campylobacterota bacterium]